MDRTLQKIESNLLSLPSSSRAYLVEKLCESLEAEPISEVEAAWSAEIERRVHDLDDGTASPIPARTVFKSVRRQLHEARRLSS